MKITDLKIEENLIINPDTDALIVIDMQYDFLPGGALAVNNSNKLIPKINTLIDIFAKKQSTIIFTQDWHPIGHKSFASSYDDKKPLDEYISDGIGPVLWPDHCVPETKGSEIHEDLKLNKAALILRKGYNLEIDSYSAFLENDKKHKTGLDGYLKAKDIKRVFIVGLALDYCVFNSAMDARLFNFETILVIDLTLPVGYPEDLLPNTLTEMSKNGIIFTKLLEIE